MKTKKIPLLDLKGQYLELREELLAAADDVLSSGAYVLGPRVLAFEEKIAAYTGSPHAIGVASGTDALLLCLMALDVGVGDEVILPTYTFFATAGVVARLGAKPIFVDVDPIHYTIDPSALERVITVKTKAVIPVHLFGQCAPLDPIMATCDGHDIPVIEDAAQSLGARYRGKQSGTIGRFGCFSFYPTKNLGGYGDGGMIVCNDADDADLLRRLRVHGARPKYVHALVGVNSRLDAIQAAFLTVKLAHLDAWSTARRENAAYYQKKLAGTKIVAPAEAEGCHHVYNQFVVRVQNRDQVREALVEAGIGSEIYYPVPMHLQTCFANSGHKIGDLPISERAAKETLSIPVHPDLTTDDMDRVVEVLLAAT